MKRQSYDQASVRCISDNFVNLIIMQFEIPLEHKHHPKPAKNKQPEPMQIQHPAGLPSSPRGSLQNSESQIFPVKSVLLELKPVKHYKPPELAVSISTAVSRIPANEILKDFIPESKRNVNGHLMKEINKRKKLIEDRIYNSEISQARDYLKHIYQTETPMDKLTRHFLEGMVQGRAVKVADDIEKGDNPVSKKKILNKQQLNDLVHYRQGELKAKITDLRDSMKNSLFSGDESAELTDVYNDKYYDRNHPKTKEAVQFIHRMNLEKQELRKKRAEARLRKQQLEQKSKKEEQESYKQHLSQRHGKLKQQYDLKLQIKVKEEQLRTKKLAEFQNFLHQYKLKKPLYKKKEEQFNDKVLGPITEQYQMKLDMIKQKYRPLDYDDLNEHERRYLQFKKDNSIRKEQQMRMVAEAHRNGNKFFKGRHRLQVLQDMLTEKEVQDPKLIQRLKKVRQLVYADNVKSRFIPRINQQKRRQIQEKIQKQTQPKIMRRRQQDRQFLGENGSIFRSLGSSDETFQVRSPQIDGKRNLQSLHRMIQNYRRQGKIKRQDDHDRAVSVTLQPKVNYLQQLRSKRQSQAKNSRYTDDFYQSSRLQDVDQFQRLKMRANLLDQHALRREKYMRIVKDEPIGGIEQGKNLEDDYLKAIKAKISLLNTNQFEVS